MTELTDRLHETSAELLAQYGEPVVLFLNEPDYAHEVVQGVPSPYQPAMIDNQNVLRGDVQVIVGDTGRPVGAGTMMRMDDRDWEVLSSEEARVSGDTIISTLHCREVRSRRLTDSHGVAKRRGL